MFQFNDTPEAGERLKANVADLMAMTEQDVLGLVPAQSGIYFTDCPHCENASNDRGNFDWTPQDPRHVTCRDCGERYPDNPRYPDDQALTVRSIGGDHAYPYYERPDGYRLYFRAHADYWANQYMAERCVDLARLWWITKDEQYARRAALILLRFAEVYPGYALHYDYPFIAKKIVPYDHGPIPEAMEHGDGPTRTAKWSWWANMDISIELAAAHDVLKHWPPLESMTEGRARELIERDLLGAMIDYVMDMDEQYDNMSPHKWRSAMQAARVLGRPAVIHDAVGRLERFLDNALLYDGSWMETSPSYMAQVAGNLSVIETALQGYADPPGYAHPQTGRHLTARGVAELLAKRERIVGHLMSTRLPDGRLIPVNDTWSFDHRAPRERMTSTLAPGFGVAVLGGGAGDTQYHAHLNFTAGEHHKHYDALSIGLWAHGQELFSDIGYTHTAYRYWVTATPSHNTVVVDGVDQAYDADYSGNRLRAFATDGRGFHLAEAEAASVYPQTSRYRRTLLAVGRDASEAYLVDVFQVHGGTQHDYILAGNADQDSTATAPDLTLKPYEGTLLNRGVTFAKPTNENDLSRPQTGLGFIHSLKRAPARECTAIDFRLTATPAVGTRTWLDAEAGTMIYLGQAPSIRRSQRRDATLDDYQMPMLIARRRGENLRSTFIAVHEPVNGSPSISNVHVIQRNGMVLVQITRAGIVDTVIVGLDGPVSYQDKDLRFQGRYGMVRTRDQQPVEAHLVGGTLLSIKDVRLAAPDSYRGVVRAIDRARASTGAEAIGGEFMVEESVTTDVAGDLMLLRYADGSTQGYNIVRTEPAEGGHRVVVREFPGFAVTREGVKLTYYPARTITSDRVGYEILTSRHHVVADD